MRSAAARIGLAVLLVLVLVAPHPVRAQGGTGVFRVGFLSPLPAVPEPPTVQAFRQGMRDLGYVEGQTYVLEARYADGRVDHLQELVADLLAHKVDVLVVGSNPVALAAKAATRSVPIVFAGIADPVAPGLVTSLARPGGNVTGVTFGVGGVGFGGKWVEILREAVPGIARVAVLYNPADPLNPQLLREVEAAARTLRLKLDVHDGGDDAKLQRALAAIAGGGARGLIVLNNPYLVARRTQIVQFAASRHLPAIYPFRLFAEAGGLMSYGGSLEESYRRAAVPVDRIRRGARPADLPVDQPTRFELVVNLGTAKALGLAIPPAVLARADRIIE